MILIDAHVHIHSSFDVDTFFDSAWHNFQKAALREAVAESNCTYVLMLAERRSEKWFENTAEKLTGNKSHSVNISKRWSAFQTSRRDTLLISNNDENSRKIYIISGVQVVTAENIEVLGLYCTERPDDGQSLKETVEQIRNHGAITVLPWGMGKWLGKRGSIIDQFISTSNTTVYLGDNGGRPFFWNSVSQLQYAKREKIVVLSGTDCLPIQSEVSRVGSYGVSITDDLHKEIDFPHALKEILNKPKGEFLPYGKLMGGFQFFRNQIVLRLQK